MPFWAWVLAANLLLYLPIAIYDLSSARRRGQLTRTRMVRGLAFGSLVALLLTALMIGLFRIDRYRSLLSSLEILVQASDLETVQVGDRVAIAGELDGLAVQVPIYNLSELSYIVVNQHNRDSEGQWKLTVQHREDIQLIMADATITIYPENPTRNIALTGNLFQHEVQRSSETDLTRFDGIRIGDRVIAIGSVDSAGNFFVQTLSGGNADDLADTLQRHLHNRGVLWSLLIAVFVGPWWYWFWLHS